MTDGATSEVMATMEGLGRRYVDLVYAAAVRQLGGQGRGEEDVTQSVFLVALKKAKSGGLPEEGRMAGWLLKVTRYAVKRARREQWRRKRHEMQAAAVETVEQEVEVDAVRLLLDEALLKLGAVDREVVVRRYLQGQAVGEVAAAVGISRNTASQRLGRALEKLRKLLAGRGLTTPAGGLAAVLGAEATLKAPAAVAASVSLGTAGASTAAVGIAKGAAVMMKMAAFKLAALPGLGILVLAGGGLVLETKGADGQRPGGQAAASKPADISPIASPMARSAPAARMFNSKLKFELWGPPPARRLGVTPAAEALAIPANTDWWVEPIGDTTVEAAALEVQAQSIPGLQLRAGADADLVHLKDLKSLRRLMLSGDVTDVGLEQLKGLTNLQVLSLAGTQVTDAGLVNLKGLQNLQELWLPGSVTGWGLEDLRGLKDLRTLYFYSQNLNDVAAEELGDFTGLTSLYLEARLLTDADLEHLKNLKGLKVLDLSITGLTDTGVENLKGLENLEWLGVAHTKVTDAGLHHLKGLKKLRSLSLDDTTLTDAGLENVIKDFPDLRRLDIGSTKLTDAGLTHLKDLRGLQDLSLYHTNVTDAGIEHLMALQGLQFLDLTGTQVTAAGLDRLKELKRLDGLDIGSLNLTDATLEKLTKNFPGLRELVIDTVPVTDAGLEYVKTLSQLQYVALTGTKVTDDGVKKLQEALPKCWILWHHP